MKKRKANIKQHYIPQCYLRNFTDDKGFLNVYNYKNYREYKVRPNKVSWGRYFHDVNVELFNSILEIDDAYSEIVDDRIRILHEDLFAKSASRLAENLEKVDHGITFTKEDRISMVNFIMIQHIRTPEYRSNIDYLTMNFIRFYFNDLRDVDVKDEEYLPTIHNLIIYGLLHYLNGEYEFISSNYDMFFGHLFDEYSVMMKQLDNGTVRFIVNRTEVPFITTSNPVNICFNPETYSRIKALLVTPDKSKRVVDIGNYNEMLRVTVPLSSKVCIMFLDKKYAEILKVDDFGIQVIEQEDVDIVVNMNLSMAARCNGTLYSRVNEYQGLQEMIDLKSSVSIKLFR